MSGERFDHIARLLAQGTSRRQILKGFAAGLGASLFSTLGFGSAPSQQHIAHAAPQSDGSYLPLIRVEKGPRFCAIASDCDTKVICNTQGSKECRCIESAEGVIRCGEVPLCSAPRCTTSADCAELGEGYFCETVGSGCCGDDEQRCIPPCKTEMACPEERLCGTKCCAENAMCQDGTCVDPVAGTWTGTLTYEEQSIGIRFVFDEQRRGSISGRILLQDPVSKKYLETGPVSGTYRTEYANLNLESDSFFFGNFEGDKLTGDFTFAFFNDEEGITATVAMQRA
jgi:hypothetical protein